jgi:hypothetical protein
MQEINEYKPVCSTYRENIKRSAPAEILSLVCPVFVILAALKDRLAHSVVF